MKKFLILGLIPLLLMVPGTAFAIIDPSQFPSNQDIPVWVKNTAGWWAENKISDDEFLTAISYLKNNNIIFPKIHVINTEVFRADDYQYNSTLTVSEKLERVIPEISAEEVTEEKSIWHNSINDALENPEKTFSITEISGALEDNSARIPITIEIFTPGGEVISSKAVGNRGEYSSLIRPIENQVPGIYELRITNDDKVIESGYLFLQGTPEKIPSWIKNTAGWWASDEISDDDFVVGIQFLVDTDMIKPKVEPKSVKREYPILMGMPIPNDLLLSGFRDVDISGYKSIKECRDDLVVKGKATSTSLQECKKIVNQKMDEWLKPFSDESFSAYDSSNSKLINEKAWKEHERKIAELKRKLATSEKDYSSVKKSDKNSREYDYSNHYNSKYYDYDYYGYYGSYGFSEADIQRELDRMDYYANRALSEIDPYARAYVDGRMSWSEYESKGMAILDYYSNQYLNEFNSYYP